MTQQKCLWRLVHKDSDRTIKHYTTLAGARIAQRLRNYHLGFYIRKHRMITNDREFELCETISGEILTATWCIEELTVDQESFD